MPDIRKWNYQKGAYEHYIPPVGHISLYEPVMETPIVCASCGKQITFGEGYTSFAIHNCVGFGYSVCESCHEAELAEELNSRKEQINND